MRIQIIVNQGSILLSRTRSCADPQTRRSKKMDPKRSNRRVQIDSSQLPKYDIAEDDPTETLNWNDDEDEIGGNGMRVRTSNRNVTENQDPFMGVKVRRKASLRREYQGDYIDVPSHPNLMKILQRQGDKQVLFADKLLKCTGTGKIKQRILLITDVAVYILDPETDTLKRRIALVAVEKMCLSELTDNFFAIIIPTEYDLLMASPRKTEIVTVLSEVTKTSSNYELEIVFSNSFQYNAAAEMVKEVQFEEVEGGVKTRFVMK